MLNRMMLQGRLTHTPELRTTQSGVSRCALSVAWSEKYKDTENTLFMNCIAWRGTAEFLCKYFSKGQELVVEGPLSTRKYTGRDGVDRTITEMTVDKVHFCGPKRDNAASQMDCDAPIEPGMEGFEDIDDDGELPF